MELIIGLGVLGALALIGFILDRFNLLFYAITVFMILFAAWVTGSVVLTLMSR